MTDDTTVRLAHRESGDAGAPPLVLLHGLTSDGTAWDEVAAHFADRHRVLVPDLRGHGRSPHPGTYSFELMRDDVLAFLDELALPDVVLIGHSLGGVVAYLLAALHPERVTRLVLEETPPPVPLDRPAPQRPSEPLAYDWAAREAIVGQLNSPDPAWREAPRAVAVPTLVVAGGPESHLPQDEIAAMAARFPAGRLVTIPAGHRVHGTLPEEFCGAVAEFLAA
ncbi:alpha/beta fold hydrolase [Streptomyces fulvoviolaceus]|uniref:alpha/beta fold hydrolase n=1 Tax=Streptomyces fulvoviolaceus TaxID=285535 RepID=UPI0004C7AD2B|nr:alpha/beta fold hydrolase [Streptomyces fulvoviolaceus]